MTPTDFERRRLELFAASDFDGRSVTLTDPRGRKIYTMQAGSGGIPTIVVHGGMSNGSVWATTAGKLDGHVVVVDRPGCGLSYPMDYTGTDYTAEAAQFIADVADALGASTVNLLGNSMGGFFCMAFATRHPDRVNRMVLSGAPAGIDRHLPLFVRLWGRRFTGALITAQMAEMTDLEVFRKNVWSSLVAHPDRLSRDFLTLAMAGSSLPGTADTSRTMLATVSSIGGWRKNLLIRSAMETCPVETLILWGDKDSFAPPSSGENLAAAMPNAAFHLSKDTGHLPFLDNPEETAEAANRFFAA